MRFQNLLRLPKTSEDLVRDMVFFTNGFHLPKQIVFGIPKHFAPLEGDPNQNDTAVRVSLPEGCYRGDMGHKWLYYKRLDFGTLIASNPDGIVLQPGTFTLVSILPQINALYRINLAEGDILDASYTVGGGPVTMHANPNSLAWQGQINLPVSGPLPDMVPNTELNGFDAVSA